jgi:hypothetical protein
LEDLGIDGRIFRMNLREIGWEVGDSIYLAQDKLQSQIFVNMVINLQVQ